MGYLVTHIAACLVFAQLLGLLLGWLLWGYVARQRGAEVQTLRERLADLNLNSRRMAFAGEQRVSIAAPPGVLDTEDVTSEPAHSIQTRTGPLVEDDLLADAKEQTPFFKPEPDTAKEEAAPETPASKALPVAPDLEAEVKAARLQHFEQQVRELEGFRDRLPLLQADLSDAIAGRRTAENKLEETKTHFEIRVANLLTQIRDFERAAQEWDRVRDEAERAVLTKDKELAAAKAHLRDMQNNQLPQKAEPAPAPGMSPREVADLRDRYQKAVTERDAIAAEMEAWKQSDGSRHSDTVRLTARIAELEESLRVKDGDLSGQVARVESLLWRVAELEPFAAAAPRMEEDLRRQESEIAGHVAMHSESSDHIRELLNRVAELELQSAQAAEVRETLAAREGDMQRMAQEHAAQIGWKEAEIAHHLAATQSLEARVAEQEAGNQRMAQDQATRLDSLHAELAAKDGDIARHIAERNELAARVSDREAAMERLAQEQAAQRQAMQLALEAKDQELAQRTAAYHALEGQAAERDASGERRMQEMASQMQALRTALEEKDKDIAQHVTARYALEKRVAGLDAATAKVIEGERLLAGRDAEIRGLIAAHGDTQREMQSWQERSTQLDRALAEQSGEVQRLTQANDDKDGQMLYLQSQLEERLRAVSEQLSATQQRLQELEPLAAKAPEAEQKLALQEDEARQQMQAIEERHQTELTRLKFNSAQRIRRIRQSINNFKG